MKQYLMMCDERGMEVLKNSFRSETVQFLEVHGMLMQGNTHNALLTPILPPINPVPMPEVLVAQQANTQATPETQPEGSKCGDCGSC